MNWFKEIDAYCERVSPEFWAEPLNAFSNSFFVLAGALYLYKSIRNSEELNNTYWLYSLSSIVILVGIGSFLFHTFANTWSLLADNIPIMIFMGAYLSFVLLKPLKSSLLTCFLVVIPFLSLTLYIDNSFLKSYFNGSTSYFLAWIMLCTFAQGLYPKQIQLSQSLYSGVFVFSLSLFFRSIDMTFCKIIPVGTHFIWHTLNACLLLILLSGAYTFSKKEPAASTL